MTEEMKAMIELVGKSLKEGKPMSKADKMFADLGYRLHKENSEFCIFIKTGGRMINFERESIFNESNKGVELHDDKKIQGLSIYELIAINEKMKELGWMNE